MMIDRAAGPPATFGSQVRSALLSFPVACFTLALLTDLAYWRSAELIWHDFSSWLLLAGQIGGWLALIAWLFARPWRYGIAWPGVLLALTVLVAAFFNSLLHAGDGWTAIIPWGILLSALTVLLMIAAAWLERDSVHLMTEVRA